MMWSVWPATTKRVAHDLAEVDRRAEHVERALDETVGQVEVEEVGVQPGRQARRVVVPEEDVERRRVLAQQVVVDPVVPHEVVGAQPREDLGHVVAGEHTRPQRPRPRRLDGSSGRQGGDRGLGTGVEPGDEERRRVHEARLPGGGEVTEQRGERDAAGAEADGVGVVGAGDVAGDADRVEDRPRRRCRGSSRAARASGCASSSVKYGMPAATVLSTRLRPGARSVM